MIFPNVMSPKTIWWGRNWFSQFLFIVSGSFCQTNYTRIHIRICIRLVFSNWTYSYLYSVVKILFASKLLHIYYMYYTYMWMIYSVIHNWHQKILVFVKRQNREAEKFEKVQIISQKFAPNAARHKPFQFISISLKLRNFAIQIF